MAETKHLLSSFSHQKPLSPLMLAKRLQLVEEVAERAQKVDVSVSEWIVFLWYREHAWGWILKLK